MGNMKKLLDNQFVEFNSDLDFIDADYEYMIQQYRMINEIPVWDRKEPETISQIDLVDITSFDIFDL